MIVTSHRNNYESLYKYLTTTVDGVVTPVEIETKEQLDARIEKMLNEDGYAKKDFIVVQVVDYSIDATNYTDDEPAPDDSTTDTQETE
jgi:hypothetical protein